MRQTTTYSATLLSPASSQRFHALLELAEPRGVCAWQEVPLANAELLLLDGGVQTLTSGWPPCLVSIGGPVPRRITHHPSQRIFHLEADFTGVRLLDVLDRAAVWLLQIRSQGASRVERSASVSALRYKLRRWVTLGEESAQPEYVLASALLTREFMTLEVLCNRAGLTTEQAQRLLVELAQLDALVIEIPAHAPDPSLASPLSARGGLFTRLSRLLLRTKAKTDQDDLR